MLSYRRMKKSEKKYALRLSREEVNIGAKRLDDYKTLLIYNGKKRIGFVSFGFRPDKTIYIYILAFEKQAQRQGFGSMVTKTVLRYGLKRYNHFQGLSARIHKANGPAINAAKKYGFLVSGERKNYFDLIRPASSHEGNQQ